MKQSWKISKISLILIPILVIVLWQSRDFKIINKDIDDNHQWAETEDLNNNEYYKNLKQKEKVIWLGKISDYYTQISGIKFCIIDDNHQDIDIKQPCDWFWATSDDIRNENIIGTNPKWDGQWVDYTLNYYDVPFNKDEDFYNEIYTIEGYVVGLDCGVSDECVPDIDIINITK